MSVTREVYTNNSQYRSRVGSHIMQDNPTGTTISKSEVVNSTSQTISVDSAKGIQDLGKMQVKAMCSDVTTTLIV